MFASSLKKTMSEETSNKKKLFSQYERKQNDETITIKYQNQKDLRNQDTTRRSITADWSEIILMLMLVENKKLFIFDPVFRVSPALRLRENP